jgi:hypothetical protein
MDDSKFQHLHASRSEAAQKLSRLQAVQTRLAAAGDAEAAVLTEIGELGAEEIEAVKGWAASGCEGPQPQPDSKRRRILNEKLAAASAAREAAAAAGTDVATKITEANAVLAAIDQQIENEIFDQLEKEHGAIFAELEHVAETGCQLVAKLLGLPKHYRNLADAALNRSDQARSIVFHQRAAAFQGKIPVMGVSQNEIEAAAQAWSRRIIELKSGAA